MLVYVHTPKHFSKKGKKPKMRREALSLSYSAFFKIRRLFWCAYNASLRLAFLPRFRACLRDQGHAAHYFPTESVAAL